MNRNVVEQRLIGLKYDSKKVWELEDGQTEVWLARMSACWIEFY